MKYSFYTIYPTSIEFNGKLELYHIDPIGGVKFEINIGNLIHICSNEPSDNLVLTIADDLNRHGKILDITQNILHEILEQGV